MRQKAITLVGQAPCPRQIELEQSIVGHSCTWAANRNPRGKLDVAVIECGERLRGREEQGAVTEKEIRDPPFYARGAWPKSIAGAEGLLRAEKVSDGARNLLELAPADTRRVPQIISPGEPVEIDGWMARSNRGVDAAFRTADS
jgi:hypothetical protein